MELNDYEEFIVKNGFVKENKKSYYSAWVKKFFKSEISEKLLEGDRINQFLNYLQLENKYQEWQIEQAREAVELYLNIFKNKRYNTEILKEFPDGERIMRTFTEIIRLKHYSYRTEETYRQWVFRYLEYCIQMNLDYKSSSSVKHFLTNLAVKRKVAASTQNQAFNAILFLFKYILQISLKDIKGTVRAKGKRNLPVVLSVEEVRVLFESLSGTRRLILELIYGCGLRISELVRLRVQDLDFANGILRIVDAKGGKDRAVSIPKRLEKKLHYHLKKVKEVHEEDLSIGCGEVYLPFSVGNKNPKAAREWKWQYVFPSKKISVDPRSGKRRRHHILDKSIQDTMKKAVSDVGIVKKATVHTLRHSFATHLLMSGVNIREIQELLGHKNVETTMIYTHVMKDLCNMPESPLDSLYE